MQHKNIKHFLNDITQQANYPLYELGIRSITSGYYDRCENFAPCFVSPVCLVNMGPLIYQLPKQNTVF